MSSCAVVDRDAVAVAFDALDAAVDGVLGLDFEALATRERLALSECCEGVRRRLPAVEHPLINQLASTPPRWLRLTASSPTRRIPTRWPV